MAGDATCNAYYAESIGAFTVTSPNDSLGALGVEQL